MAELSVRHREMLAFEAQWWRHEVSRPTAVRQLFGLTEQRYQQIMNVIIQWPQALAHDPLLVRRLRRDRAAARADRTGLATCGPGGRARGRSRTIGTR